MPRSPLGPDAALETVPGIAVACCTSWKSRRAGQSLICNCRLWRPAIIGVPCPPTKSLTRSCHPKTSISSNCLGGILRLAVSLDSQHNLAIRGIAMSQSDGRTDIIADGYDPRRIPLSIDNRTSATR